METSLHPVPEGLTVGDGKLSPPVLRPRLQEQRGVFQELSTSVDCRGGCMSVSDPPVRGAGDELKLPGFRDPELGRKERKLSEMKPEPLS